MSDIIRLLPDSVASQIAAGEVIQRPASALKELLENSIDSGARQINVVLKEAGKALIQVVDDGCGMTENDARLCFERHATSKIREAADLFTIYTMGFRGEALASIAAIARVEMKTRTAGEETGVQLTIEGSELKDQKAVSCAPGTSIAVRNLFFNTPARRNFLKSNAAETRHLIEAFQRVAIAHPRIGFSMHHDGNEVFRLATGNLRQRIAAIFGNNYNERLVPLEEESMAIKISGFLGKPQFAKKTRGEQFLFVNGRFVRDPYLNHAISGGMDELLPAAHHPSYFITIHADPAVIDVNIHPSKTEVKFEDERLVYSVMKATVKRALGRFSIMPSLDFDQERSFQVPLDKLDEIPRAPSISINKNYNPFAGEGMPGGAPAQTPVKGWENLYEQVTRTLPGQPAAMPSRINFDQPGEVRFDNLPEECFSMFGSSFLMVRRHDELMLARRAGVQERIFFEQLMRNANTNHASQQNLFPQAIEFSAGDFVLLKEMGDDIQRLGFDIREFGKNTFVVHGIPFGTQEGQAKKLLEEVLEDYKHNAKTFSANRTEAIARAIARNRAGQGREPLLPGQVKELLMELFRCDKPWFTPGGKQLFIRITAGEIGHRFSEQEQA